jgi:monofunctional chorismate mutase
MKLKDWRNEIDLIDDEIIRLINQRTRIVKKIGTLKAKAGLPINDPAREKQILEKIYLAQNLGSEKKSISGIYRKILHESRQIQLQVVKEIKNKGAEVY